MHGMCTFTERYLRVKNSKVNSSLGALLNSAPSLSCPQTTTHEFFEYSYLIRDVPFNCGSLFTMGVVIIRGLADKRMGAGVP
ncbi:hypothetical protein CEXT_541941 [Caerostris extrusa]|uniref:Uncharacterized protein n=1 Tax=Caerostris extrusa TaxID=172846 RepID=A0AAV4MHR1_CAEEX|nr:hypothetical protein CEXT_541941 [Caerostris extrusa]